MGRNAILLILLILAFHSPIILHHGEALNENPVSKIIMKSIQSSLKTNGIDISHYSTYLGGLYSDVSFDITTDQAGYVYVTGYTASSDFPIEDGLNYSHSGWRDRSCFISKLDPSGQSLIYSSFIGGSGDDEGHSIAVDDGGNVYVVGETRSDDFPTVNAYDDTHNGESDYFLVKLNSTGNGILFSTYIGGSLSEREPNIVVVNGNAYIAGWSWSPDFPVLDGYDSSNDGDHDCVVFKVNTTSGSLQYSTFIGGHDGDRCKSIDVDMSGNVYVTGETNSHDFPLVNPIDSTFEGYNDGFVFKLNSTGTGLNFSSYIGGYSLDRCMGISVDEENAIYITGFTESGDFPLVNAFDDSYNGNRDCFVLKINPHCDEFVYSTYIGGFYDDEGFDIEVDPFGNAFVVGETRSAIFPTQNAYDNTLNGSRDCFLFKLDSNGTKLYYSTYIGGSSREDNPQLAIDEFGCAYITGDTESHDFPTFNSFDDSFNGNDDCFVFKILDLSDSDDDEMPDSWELYHGLNIHLDDSQDDPDNDDLSNIDEYHAFCNPQNNDTDFDSMPDGWEVQYSLDPLIDDSSQDNDNDGLQNYDEYQHGSNPNLVDSDHDTLSDADEVLVYGTSPTSSDSDFDEMPDNWEVFHNLDPMFDDAEQDPDHDMLSNIDEFHYGTNPRLMDSDLDGHPDYWEIMNGYDPLNPETSIIENLHYHLQSIIVLSIASGILLFAGFLVVRKQRLLQVEQEQEKSEEIVKIVEDLSETS